jgi:hypothetical protein
VELHEILHGHLDDGHIQRVDDELPVAAGFDQIRPFQDVKVM